MAAAQKHGQEELPVTQGQGRRPREPGCNGTGAAERSNPTSKKQWMHGRKWVERRYSTFKVRRGGREEIPLIQGKEQKLYFAGGAMKRYPMSKVREAQVKW